MEPFLGGIYIVGFNFAPEGYSMCNGQLLSISQNTALFALLGTFYGGDGTTTFGLPNLQGRVPIHQGSNGSSNYVVGQSGGTENVTLLTAQMPAHTHSLGAFDGVGTTNLPAGAYLAHGPSTGSGPNATALNTYNPDANNAGTLAALNAGAIQTVGGGQPHTNIQPYLCVTYVMAMQGVFPSRN